MSNFVSSGRGRGLYRNRGRGNYYRHPAPHQQLPMAQHSHSTMPYYDPSVNLINTRGGPYRDSSYQDIQHNRYETVTPFDKKRDRIINLMCIIRFTKHMHLMIFFTRII